MLSGKRHFTNLLCTYLHAHRVILKETVVSQRLETLRCEPGQDIKKLGVSEGVKKVLTSTAGGVILVTLGDESIDENETAMSKRATMLKDFLEMIESRSVVVVLATSWIRASKLLHAEAALSTALHWHVNIADFTPHKMTEIAIEHARATLGCVIAQSVQTQLQKHFEEAYDDLGLAGNAHLAHMIVEKADRRREVAFHMCRAVL